MKYLSIIKYVLLAFSVLTIILFNIDLMLYWAYILLALTLVTALAFPLANIVQNPKGAMRSVIGLAIVLVVLGISYALASDIPVVNAAGDVYDNSTTLKLTDMGLYATYTALFGTILIILYFEIRNAFK